MSFEKRQIREPGSGRRHWNSKASCWAPEMSAAKLANSYRLACSPFHGGGWSSASCKSLKNPLIRPARFPGGKRAHLNEKSPLFRYYVLKKDKQYNTTQVIPTVTKLHPQALEVTMKPFKGVTDNHHHPKRVTISQNCQVTSFSPKWATKENPYYFPLYRLFNRDPYNGLL